jgi:hypothetical protein
VNASRIAILRYIIGSAGVFAGFYLLFSQGPVAAVGIVALVGVGFVGIISFFSHVVFAESDARRLSAEGGAKFFQYEVGFANLSIGIFGIVAYLGGWATPALTAIVFIYGLYLALAAILILWRATHGQPGATGRGYAALLYAGMLLFFGIASAYAIHLPPL